MRLSGKDVFVCLPTGFGKSLCFHCLPYVFDVVNGHTSPYSQIVVVSPLTSLMKDQIKVLDDRGMKAVHVTKSDDRQLKDEVLLGKYQIIFTSPEVLLQDKDWTDVFRNSLFTSRLVGIIIVKKW